MAREIRDLIGADAAVLLLWTRDSFRAYPIDLEPEAVNAYLRHYSSSARGTKQQGRLGIEVWSREAAPQRSALESRERGTEPSRPDWRCEAVGRPVHAGRVDGLEALDVDACLALLYREAAPRPSAPDARLGVLNALLPAFRAGLILQLRLDRWLESAPRLLDHIGHQLALFSLSGRELYRNVVLRRVLSQEPERALVEHALRTVASAAAGLAQHAHYEPDDHSDGRTARQEVQTRSARYRLRGSIIGPELLGPQMATLVSVDRVDAQTPSPELLCQRHGLTAREGQIASLLAQRLTNDEIASIVVLSPHTVRHHTESVLLKLGVHSRRMLRQVVMESGF